MQMCDIQNKTWRLWGEHLQREYEAERWELRFVIGYGINVICRARNVPEATNIENHLAAKAFACYVESAR